MKGLLLACQVSGIRSLKDKSVIISLETQEIAPDIAGELFRLQGLIVSAYIKESTPDTNEIDKVNRLELENTGRSSSQKQRDLLFRIWEHNNQGYKDFNAYYAWRMEQNLNKLRTELDSLK